MIVNLRVYDPPETWWQRLFKRKEKQEPITTEKKYTPAIVDLSEVHFAYVDADGDINIQKKEGTAFYAIEYSDQLFNMINAAMQNDRKKTTGFVNNLE